MQLSISETLLLDLLRAALWNKPLSENYSNIPEDIWNAVYSLSVSQGIQAIIFDSITSLSKSQAPPKSLMLTWAVNTSIIEKRYAHQHNIICEIDSILKENGIDMLLLKGLGLSAIYPIPNHRECGDIDIYLYNKKTEGDVLLQKNGTVLKVDPKHSVTIIKGIPVENHYMFGDTYRFKAFFDNPKIKSINRIEKSLLSILEKENCSYYNGDQIKIPTANFNFIFLVYHTGIHLPGEEKLVLRHLCDWACFLSNTKGMYDESVVEKALTNLNYKQLASLMTDFCVEYLELSEKYIPSFLSKQKNSKLTQKLYDDMLHPLPICPGPKNRYKRFMNQIRKIKIEHWKFALIYDENIVERGYRKLLRTLKN